ncbi:MAG: hypothetical protein WC564_04050 [Patescibacteria group bacterium]
MPKRISDLLNIDSAILDSKGVFDSFVDVDSKLYIDPSLLEHNDIPELSDSHNKFKNYFNEIIILLSKSVGQDVFRRGALKRLIIKENNLIHLGYSSNNPGSAIGKKIASEILETAIALIKEGITDPIIFELLGLFEEGVGADRISDMTAHIIFNDLVLFTKRISKELNLKVGDVGLPLNIKNNKPIIFIPKNILRDLPVAYDWSSIDYVCQHNRELRERVNKIIGNNWKKATRVSKKVLKNIILSNPELLKDLIDKYGKKVKTPYDFKIDPAGEVIWANLSKRAVDEYPIDFGVIKEVDKNSLLDIVEKICKQFSQLIEYNGWFEFLYNKNKLRHERFAQKLFYGVADSYCEANNLDLSRESNAGNGSVDFKISRGYFYKINVEIKYSSNPNLLKGFSRQLPAYNKAEKADKSVYVVIKTENNSKKIDNLFNLKEEILKNESSAPDLIIVDGRKKKTPSRIR